MGSPHPCKATSFSRHSYHAILQSIPEIHASSVVSDIDPSSIHTVFSDTVSDVSGIPSWIANLGINPGWAHYDFNSLRPYISLGLILSVLVDICLGSPMANHFLKPLREARMGAAAAENQNDDSSPTKRRAKNWRTSKGSEDHLSRRKRRSRNMFLPEDLNEDSDNSTQDFLNPHKLTQEQQIERMEQALDKALGLPVPLEVDMSAEYNSI
eukprot:Nitzschia sp. Nitz4//scaffold75_size92586//55304//55936//NITZ4_004859-RA/size92586-processed-gene-0.35-mRNA-1//-1//CDS//3329557717//9468//frame0